MGQIAGYCFRCMLGYLPIFKRPLKNKEMEGRGVLGIKGASERGGSKE
ncbi:hypothetical protein PGF_00017070 [Porphyromonas gingivalis 381]|nr:hypothetical protein PGF_00017070 [Porphyromonas gingivalis 381]